MTDCSPPTLHEIRRSYEKENCEECKLYSIEFYKDYLYTYSLISLSMCIYIFFTTLSFIKLHDVIVFCYNQYWIRNKNTCNKNHFFGRNYNYKEWNKPENWKRYYKERNKDW
jgi:hypothetical protein